MRFIVLLVLALAAMAARPRFRQRQATEEKEMTEVEASTQVGNSILDFVPFSIPSTGSYQRGRIPEMTAAEMLGFAYGCHAQLSQPQAIAIAAKREGWGRFHAAVIGQTLHIHVVFAVRFDYNVAAVTATAWLNNYRNMVIAAWSGRHQMRHVSVGGVTTNYNVQLHIEYTTATHLQGGHPQQLVVPPNSGALNALKGAHPAHFSGSLTHYIRVRDITGTAEMVSTEQWALANCPWALGNGHGAVQTVELFAHSLVARAGDAAGNLRLFGAGHANDYLIPAEHEFGHMIGLPDEYAIMNGVNYGRYIQAWRQLATDANVRHAPGNTEAEINPNWAAGNANAGAATPAILMNIMNYGRVVNRHHYLSFYQAWRNILHAAGTNTGTFTIV